MLTGSSGFFLKGLGLGFGCASVFFYFIHMETIDGLKTQWLVEQQALAEEAIALKTKATTQQQIETIDLLMKSYAISDGNEDQDMRTALVQSGHMRLLEQLIAQTKVDVSDLIPAEKSFNSAQLYAALLRMKQTQERMNARNLLDQRLQSDSSPANQPSQ